MRRSKNLRILHAPMSIGGNAWGLSRAERKIGLKSDVMIFNNNWLQYQTDIDLKLEKGRFSLIRLAKRILFFLRAICKYDIFVFNFGQSLFDYLEKEIYLLDLPLLKKLGKKIVVFYQGCDARQKSFVTKNFGINACAICNRCSTRQDEIKTHRIQKFSRYADRIFTVNPDLIYVLPKNAEFIPYTNLEYEQLICEVPPTKKEGRIKILHIPTDRKIKGTKYIVDACKKLSKRYDVELMLIEKIPHHQAMRIYQQADILVDQLLIGWYGGVAVELMASGKPVVCYIREQDLQFIPEEMKKELPIINANPSNIYKILENLIFHRETLIDIGKRSRDYVKRWHNPIKIAQRMKKVYEEL